MATVEKDTSVSAAIAISREDAKSLEVIVRRVTAASLVETVHRVMAASLVNAVSSLATMSQCATRARETIDTVRSAEATKGRARAQKRTDAIAGNEMRGTPVMDATGILATATTATAVTAVTSGLPRL